MVMYACNPSTQKKAEAWKLWTEDLVRTTQRSPDQALPNKQINKQIPKQMKKNQPKQNP